MASSQASNTPTNDKDDQVTVEDIEQLCNQMSKYEPSFRISLIQYHLKRLGISYNDERLVKLLTLSYETMIRSIVSDCAHVNKDNHTTSKTLTSELLNQTLLNTTTAATDNNNEIITNTQQSTNSTLDINDFF
ncbi:unnamed protein product [Rotaria sp. Silwood1]|nr:unnamed protein product [Rotaria sp. Silwood1]CAF3586695.1 unnamed protein product [Rotaria sp. Silwood1]CAF3638026.1 unnamed protein product [Rotaria sp. Silwood1]CAF5004788.1 unnamed protein product [Rotaria sp. Silwood1]CAF5036043.1 unnamed protein product [Rotaria sp. Silwood1]